MVEWYTYSDNILGKRNVLCIISDEGGRIWVSDYTYNDNFLGKRNVFCIVQCQSKSYTMISVVFTYWLLWIHFFATWTSLCLVYIVSLPVCKNHASTSCSIMSVIKKSTSTTKAILSNIPKTFEKVCSIFQKTAENYLYNRECSNLVPSGWCNIRRIFVHLHCFVCHSIICVNADIDFCILWATYQVQLLWTDGRWDGLFSIHPNM